MRASTAADSSSSRSSNAAAADTDDNTTPTTTISNRGFDLVGFTLALDNLTILVMYLDAPAVLRFLVPPHERRVVQWAICWLMMLIHTSTFTHTTGGRRVPARRPGFYA